MEEKNYERILDYLEGAMAPEERQKFEKEMSEDRALSAEVTLAERALAAQGEKEVIQLRENLERIMEENPPADKVDDPLPGRTWVWPLVLVAVGLLAAFFFEKEKQRQPVLPLSPVAAFEKYYAPPDTQLFQNLQSGVRADSDEDTLGVRLSELAFQLKTVFANQEIDAALSTIGIIRDRQSADSSLKIFPETKLLLFEGILKMWQGNPEAAISIFDEIENRFRADEQAQWYRAGALLAAGKKDDAVTEFKKIRARHTHPKREAARKILEEMGGG